MEKVQAQLKSLAVLLVGLLVFSMNGCVYLVVGGVGALGGYVISPDTVEGTVVERDYETVWNTAADVFSRQGIIELQNDATGVLEGKIQSIDVAVTVFRVGVSSVKISVKARRMMFPRIKTAQKIYVDIVTALDAGAGYSS